jgi:uncharacterized membrane protein
MVAESGETFMEALLVLLAVFLVLSGPVALIASIAAFKSIKDLQRRVDELVCASHRARTNLQPFPPKAEPAKKVEPGPVFDEVKREPAVPAPPKPAPQPAKAAAFFQRDMARPVAPEPGPAPRSDVTLEQRIGTRWVLIAGVITVMFAVGFFLKYAYDQHWIGPLGRVLIAGFSGLVALTVGELTRRRGYDIAAKGMTALGFAILYATVFAAHRWYHLIGSPTSFALAIGVTAGAMLYAVMLDEIVIAMLSLIGGYLTPVVLATGQNLPTPLFSYVLILSAGAVACAYWRKWSPVNILVLVGTYLLYTGWFERFYRPAMGREGPPEQLGVALFWLAVFFAVYLVLPLLHTLVRRVKSATQDVVLVLANAVVVFYYLWTVLDRDYQSALALCSVGMGVAHLALAGAVLVRCRDDANLCQVLMAAGLAFITLAVPLYFEVYTVAMLWAVEALLLVVVGLRYRNILVQLEGAVVLALAVADLLTGLPMHIESFRPVFNTAFGTWCFVAAAVMACHVLYRFDKHLAPDLRLMSTQGLYVIALGLFMATITMELWWHAELNLSPRAGEAFFWKQMTLVFAGFILLFIARPICPRGQASRLAGTLLAIAAAIDAPATLPSVHARDFTMFLNGDFARAILLIAVLFAAAWLSCRTERREPDGFVASGFVALGTILVLWILLTEEIWLYYDRLRPSQWRFLAQMYISVLWAVYATALMAVGFWRRVRPLRYLALGIFVLLLAKIFLIDTRELETVYRIAGFLVTGLALVGISYLYQYLKKTGFFDTMLAEKSRPD